MKEIVIVIVMFFVGILLADGIIVVRDGVYSGSEDEFVNIIGKMNVKHCPTAIRDVEPWLDDPNDGAIFASRYYLMPFFDYHFHKGKYIPRKYSHLVEEKIKNECNKSKIINQ